MKKFPLVLVLVATLMVLTVTVTSADPPDGVGPAVKVDGVECFIGRGSLYTGTATYNYSNSKAGNATIKCKAEIVSGEPIFAVFEEVIALTTLCEPGVQQFTNVEFNGDKAIAVIHCTGLRSP